MFEVAIALCSPRFVIMLVLADVQNPPDDLERRVSHLKAPTCSEQEKSKLETLLKNISKDIVVTNNTIVCTVERLRDLKKNKVAVCTRNEKVMYSPCCGLALGVKPSSPVPPEPYSSWCKPGNKQRQYTISTNIPCRRRIQMPETPVKLVPV